MQAIEQIIGAVGTLVAWGPVILVLVAAGHAFIFGE